MESDELVTAVLFERPSPAVRGFFLRQGRVEMDLNKKPAKAARWFQSYLDDSPGGSLAEEALGRLITALRKAGNEAAASKAAARYLEKYPTGTFREIALAVASNS